MIDGIKYRDQAEVVVVCSWCALGWSYQHRTWYIDRPPCPDCGANCYRTKQVIKTEPVNQVRSDFLMGINRHLDAIGRDA